MQIKAELRKQLLIARSRIPESVKKELSEKIAERLFFVREFREADSVFCYISKEKEISTGKIISHCLSEGKRVAAPVCIGEEMIFRYITGFDDLEKGSFSVYEPKSICPKAEGFYDRFFEKNECVKIGLCLDEYIRDFKPDINDIAADIIVTESKVLPIL